MHLSRRRIQEFLGDGFHLELSIATINQCIHEAARALEPVVEEPLLQQARDSGLLHADETRWFEAGKLVWLWVFTSATTSVFTIGARSKAVLMSVLGPLFNGWLMSDGYWADRDLDNRLRCLAHVQRKARSLEESLDRQAFVLRVLLLHESDLPFEVILLLVARHSAIADANGLRAMPDVGVHVVSPLPAFCLDVSNPSSICPSPECVRMCP
jgi:hypothetical protein